MQDMTLCPYLTFQGNCEEAMQFYMSVFGGTLDISRFGDYANPDMPVDDSFKDKVMHAVLKQESITFMASDSAPGTTIILGNNVSMSLAGQDEAKLTEYFNALAEGGQVTLPLGKQVWGDTFGMLTDKLGIHWFININSGE